MIALYYSGSQTLREIVAPDTGKEFGLLENFQNVILIAIAVVAVIGLKRKQRRWERIALAVLLAGTIFMLLEETDYGFQYVRSEPLNLHEVGQIERTMEHIARFGGLIFFGAFAIVFANSRNPLLRYLAPDRLAVLTILIVTALWELAIRLPKTKGSIAGHELEFAELGVYYLVLVYVADLVFCREYEPDAARSGER